jgi:carbonic anhydrase
VSTPQPSASPASEAFRATTKYEASHPSALAVYCSDGRFTESVEELFRHLGHSRLDTLTLPGGPGLLDSGTSSLFMSHDIAKSALFLIEGHKLKHVVLIAHEGCGYYRQRYQYSPGTIRERQLADLRSAAKALRQPYLHLRIDTFYASIAGDRIAFEPVR